VARPALKRQAVGYLVEHHRYSKRRACRLVRQHRSNEYYRSVKDPRNDLRARMKEIAQVRVRYGYRRIHVLLKREGWKLGKHQMYRFYGEEQLQLRSKLPKRRKMLVNRRERVQADRPDAIWGLDFVADQLADGTRFRALTIVDVFSREALAIEIGMSWRASTGWSRSARHRDICLLTTQASSRGGCSTCGPITIKSRSISAGRASRPTIASSRPSTGHCATNA
jgi:putative transposase